MLPHANALEPDSQRVEVTFGDRTTLHDAHGSNVFIPQVDPRGDDACGKDPFGGVEGDEGFDFSGPSIESEEVHGGKGINSVDGD